MDSPMIRLFDPLKRVSLVTFLSAAATTALPTQAARAWLFQSIAAGWLAAVAAMLGQLVAQRLDSGCLLSHRPFQLHQPLLHRQHERYEGFFIQFS